MSKAEQREQRLAEALRANLRRRKEQGRAVAEQAGEQSSLLEGGESSRQA